MARVSAKIRAAAASLVFVALLVFGAAPALAQFGAEFGERYALVIGNSDYSHVEDLPNTARDAEAMAEALEALRFTVYKGIDLTAAQFERLIEDFDAAATDADTVVFYYAGHGFQLDGLNHLAPVDAVLRDRARIGAETFVLDDIVARIHRRQRQTIVFLDACRNNPLPASARDDTGSGLASGLAQVVTGDGIFVAFATQPGNVSYDGTGRNSPFTEALLTHIGKPHRNISSLMIDVRNEVSDRTLGRQVPWDQSSLRADFHFNPGTPAGQQVAAREPAGGGLVIGRPGDSAIRGRGDAVDTVPGIGPAPRQSPITIGPAPALPPAVTEPAGPAAQPETAAAPVKPRARPEQLTAAVTARATPDTVAPASSARATPDTVAPASSARATPDTVALASSARATPDKVAALATDSERPATVTAAPTTRAQAPTTVTRTAALAQPETVSDVAGPAPVERLRPDREWFPDDAASSSQEAAEAEERQTAALAPVEPLETEPEAPREPLIDQRELARSIQGDLARLGCYRMTVDGVWGPGSRNSLAQFYREKGEAATSLEPTTDVLAMLQDESGTVCAPPQRPKKQIATPPEQKKAPARAAAPPQQQKKAPARAAAPPAPQRPTASAPPPPAAARTPPRILGF